MEKKASAEKAVREIRRRTRRRFSAEEKITDRDREAAGAQLLSESQIAMEAMPPASGIGHGFADVMAHRPGAGHGRSRLAAR
jgi:hypothetical protein